MIRKPASLLLPFAFLIWFAVDTRAQSGTTGGIGGIVKDANGGVIARAEITVVSRATGEESKSISAPTGNYAVMLLLPGIYRVSIKASGFKQAVFENVPVNITQTTTVNAQLEVGNVTESVTISIPPPLLQSDGPQLGRVVDSRAVSEFPLATRNFTQILGLSPGTSVDLPNNTAVGRNPQNISVNGARTTQNNYQLNGVDANNIRNYNFQRVSIPAPETIQEFKVQTSLYDSTFGRSGGNIQAVTRSGTNEFHGAGYEYFRNAALNANNPFLKAAGVKRPVLNRNVFGGLLGGPIKRDRVFFFGSYQGTRELNGASPNSLSSNVLIAPGLSDDRSEQALRRTFGVSSINPISLALVNLKLPSGQFLIPTPQPNGRYSGSAPSTYHEDQFNTNFDYRINERNWLAMKFVFLNSPQTNALPAGPNVPGFAANQTSGSRLVSVQDVHTFSATVINEARIGYNLLRFDNFPDEPLKDSDVGISRANANVFPGLPLIRIAPNAGGIVFGTGTVNIDLKTAIDSTTVADILSLTTVRHSIRTGAEVIYYRHNSTENFIPRGQIDFNTFNDFLTGSINQTLFGTGISERSLRAADYSFFVQDDWKISHRWTLNLGLRYDLDMPPYDTRGRITDFDPALYKPRPLSNTVVTGLTVPVGGFVQAGNVIPQYDLPDVPNVDKRIVKSIDPNNFAPRVGFAFSPLDSGHLVLRGGYGVFYSRISFTNVAIAIQLPPDYIVGRRSNPPFATPFFAAPSSDEFPIFVPSIDLATPVFDRNLRTPYFHQYNASVQYALRKDLALEVAYVGSRGINLLRNVGINQSPLASPQHPIINDVTGAVITTNTPTNAQQRAPYQGVALSSAGSSIVPGFSQTQTTAQSNYNSMQISATQRLSKGLQFLAAYTFSKSIDNSSGGAGSAGVETVPILGNQFDNRANRGVSNFDRTHRLVFSYLWDLPGLHLASQSTVGQCLLANWEVAGIVTAMSGLPIDIMDSNAGSFYLGAGNGLSRPSWVPGASLSTATTDIPSGYFFNPFAFMRPIVLAGQSIPSSNGTATAAITGTDFGNVGTNVLRGPKQMNVDFSVIKRFPFHESKSIELHAEFFNLFNHVNFANPISNLNAFASSGGSIDVNGRIINAGDFGRITSTSNNPRLIQMVLKVNF